MSDLVQTCLVIVQIATSQTVATMVWPDGPEARAVCEEYRPKWNAEHGLPKGFEASCQPYLPCPVLKNPVPLKSKEIGHE